MDFDLKNKQAKILDCSIQFYGCNCQTVTVIVIIITLLSLSEIAININHLICNEAFMSLFQWRYFKGYFEIAVRYM